MALIVDEKCFALSIDREVEVEVDSMGDGESYKIRLEYNSEYFVCGYSSEESVWSSVQISVSQTFAEPYLVPCIPDHHPSVCDNVIEIVLD